MQPQASKGALLLLAASLTLACGGAAREGDERAATSSEAFVTWEAELARVDCERAVRCGREGRSIEACVADADRASYDRYFGGVDYLADLAAEYELAEPGTRQSCLVAVEQAPCEDARPLPASCDDVLVARAPRAEGESCGAPSPYLRQRPCEDGLVCGGETGCATCVASPADGDACGGVEPCVRPLLGEACPDGACANGACVEGTCVPFVGVDQPCGDGAFCVPGLTCEGTCVAPAGPGEPCARFPSGAASRCSAWCVFGAPDDAEGTCSTPSFEGPTPCSFFGLSTTPYCPWGTYQDTNGEPLTLPSTCLCLPQLPLGAACDPNAATVDVFATGQCRKGFCSSSGVCESLRAGAAACASSSECESSSCDEALGQCVETMCQLD